MYSSSHSLTSTLDGGEWSASRPDRFTPRESAPGIHWIGGWVGPRTVLDAVVKKIRSPRQESHPRTPIVQPVAMKLNSNLTETSLYKISECKIHISLETTTLLRETFFRSDANLTNS
jgi:hypothetical protein